MFDLTQRHASMNAQQAKRHYDALYTLRLLAFIPQVVSIIRRRSKCYHRDGGSLLTFWRFTNRIIIIIIIQQHARPRQLISVLSGDYATPTTTPMIGNQ